MLEMSSSTSEKLNAVFLVLPLRKLVNSVRVSNQIITPNPAVANTHKKILSVRAFASSVELPKIKSDIQFQNRSHKLS